MAEPSLCSLLAAAVIWLPLLVSPFSAACKLDVTMARSLLMAPMA